MTDKIVEAALPALMDYAEAYDMFPDVDPDPRHAVEKIINAVRPMIEAAAFERLAKVAEADGYLWAVRDDQSIEEKLEDWIRSQVKP